MDSNKDMERGTKRGVLSTSRAQKLGVSADAGDRDPDTDDEEE